MQHPDSNRMLSAILFADIVGYTSIMQRDEQAARVWLRKFKKVLEDGVPRCHGKIYQYYGDGCLATFQSAIEAVECATEMQKSLQSGSAVPVRMGIHIGEVFWEEDKLYGDGVNLASRIEGLGQPGTVFISKDVYLRIRNHKEFEVETLGSFKLKNVDYPMEVYALVNEGLTRPDIKSLSGRIKKQSSGKLGKRVALTALPILLLLLLAWFLIPGKRASYGDEDWENKESIAVLPFNDMGVEEQSYLATGIAEDILTQLSKIEGLKVISRSSSARYASMGDRSLKAIAKELGVSNLLQGSVRKYGDQVRITVQLIDPESESYIWAENFDRQLSDILIIQREVAMAVADALKVQLSDDLINRLGAGGNVDPEAYLNYQKGQQLMKHSMGTQAELDSAESYFKKAIEQDPDFTLAYVGLADLYLDALFWHRAPESVVLPKVKRVAKQALELDPDLGEIYGVLGATKMSTDKKQAEKYFRKAISLSPSYTPAYDRLAWIELYKGNEEEFKRLKDKVLQLDPLSTRYISALSYGNFVLGNYDEGIEELNRYLEIFPNDNSLLWQLGNMYVGKKNYKKAIEIFESRTLGTHTNWMLGYAHAKAGNTEKAREILEYNLEKNKTSYVPLFMIGVQYLGLGNKEKALEYLEKTVQEGSEWWFLGMIPQMPIFEELRGDPAFERIVDKVKYDGKSI